jgi:hypothetical protein
VRFAELTQERQRDGRSLEATQDQHVCVPAGDERDGVAAVVRLVELVTVGRQLACELVGEMTRVDNGDDDRQRHGHDSAEQLVVTLATVEYHLCNAYRKLGIAARGNRGEALGADRGAAAATFIVRLLAGSRSRSTPHPESVDCHWERRSSASRSTL